MAYTQTSSTAIHYMNDDHDDIIHIITPETDQGVTKIGNPLTIQQQDDLWPPLAKMKDVFSNTPGKTGAVPHTMETKKAETIGICPYRIPKVWEDQVRQQTKGFHDLEITELSKSPWAFLIIVVRKKDDTLRMCTNFRRLNMHSRWTLPNTTSWWPHKQLWKSCLNILLGLTKTHKVQIWPEEWV